MFKHTLVVLLMTVSSVTSTIAQPMISLSHTEISPRQVHLLQITTIKQEPVQESYEAWLILDSYVYHTNSDLWFQRWTCTDYASAKRPDLFISQGKRLITGNAKEWLHSAKELWISVNAIPKKGSIAVYLPWDDGASWYGHVAYVEEIGANGTIVISDMNYLWNNIVTKRTVSATSAAWYIN